MVSFKPALCNKKHFGWILACLSSIRLTHLLKPTLCNKNTLWMTFWFENHPFDPFLLKYYYVPAKDEEDNRTSPWTGWVQSLPTTEAAASHHDQNLASHEKEKCTKTIASWNIRIIDTHVVFIFFILTYSSLQTSQHHIRIASHSCHIHNIKQSNDKSTWTWLNSSFIDHNRKHTGNKLRN